MARRCIKTRKADGTIKYYYTDNDSLNFSINDCIITSALTVDSNSTYFNSAQACTQPTIKQGYSWNSTTGNRSYIIYAYVPDGSGYTAKLIPLDGQVDATPFMVDMEVGSWVGPTGITWNRRRLVDGIFAGGVGINVGNWKQVIVNKTSGVANERFLTLVAGQTVENIELTNNTAPTSTTTPTPTVTGTPTATALAFKIVSYDCNSGVLQYQMIGGNGTSINLNLPGLYSGLVNANVIATYTFPPDARVGRAMVGSATQTGVTVSISFTTSCNLTGVNTTTPTSTSSNTNTPTIIPGDFSSDDPIYYSN